MGSADVREGDAGAGGMARMAPVRENRRAQSSYAAFVATVHNRRTAYILLRAGLWAAVVALLAVGFVAYLHPDMRLDWETIARLCGLR